MVKVTLSKNCQEYPKLCRHKKTSMVVLFVSLYAGTVLEAAPDTGRKVGDYCDRFTPCEGSDWETLPKGFEVIIEQA